MTRRAPGFTIVELLIVVVVIAILAAITIVAYNGITNRAKNSAASSAAEQVAKKLLTYAAVNSEQYPSTLSEAGVSDGSATYQYRVDNSVNPKTFCVTATTQNVSYWASSTSPTPTSGACAGHAANGGSTITNLFTDPSLTGSVVFWNSFGTGGAGTRSTMTDGGAQGPSYARLRWTTAPTSGSVGTGTNVTSPASAGQSYTFSGYVRTSWATTTAAYILFSDSGGGNLPSPAGATTTTPAGGWTRVSVSGTAPAGTVAVRPWIATVSGATTPPLNATLDVDGFMLHLGPSMLIYGDGDADGWVWNGTPGNSTSTGTAT